MNKFCKNNKGFTLVEVIVVAVIVLILAAVAIPLYNQYVKDARQNVVENTAGAIAAACGSARAYKSDACPAGTITNGASGMYVVLSVADQGGGTGKEDIGIKIPEQVTVTITGTTNPKTITVEHKQDAAAKASTTF